MLVWTLFTYIRTELRLERRVALVVGCAFCVARGAVDAKTRVCFLLRFTVLVHAEPEGPNHPGKTGFLFSFFLSTPHTQHEPHFRFTSNSSTSNSRSASGGIAPPAPAAP